MSSVTEAVGSTVSTSAPTLDLDEIQAIILRPRPAPYFGTHVLLHVDDAASRPGVPPPAHASYRLLRALVECGQYLAGGGNQLYGPRGARASRRTRCRASPRRSAWAWRPAPGQLRDEGVNDPKNWDAPFGTGQVHIGVSAFSDSEEKWRHALAVAREQYEAFSGVSVLRMQNFGFQPGDLNPLGYKDGIDQPAIEGSGAEPLPGQGPLIKAGEFILGYPGEAGVPLPMPEPEILGRNGTYVGFRKYQSRVGAFNRFLRAHGSTEEERELLAAKLVGRWRSGAPLTLAPEVDDAALGADPRRNNDFNYADDKRGLKAPLGCHIRRMNPRDTELTRLTDVNIHRLIRRGTTYGPPYDPNAVSTRSRRDTARRHLPVHQRQGDGDDGIPATGVDRRGEFPGDRGGA